MTWALWLRSIRSISWVLYFSWFQLAFPPLGSHYPLPRSIESLLTNLFPLPTFLSSRSVLSTDSFLTLLHFPTAYPSPLLFMLVYECDDLSIFVATISIFSFLTIPSETYSAVPLLLLCLHSPLLLCPGEFILAQWRVFRYHLLDRSWGLRFNFYGYL